MVCCCKFKVQHRNYIWIRWFRLIPAFGEFLYKWVMKALGPVMFVGANILIVSVAVLFQFIVVPELTGGSTAALVAYTVCDMFLLVNIFFHYFSCSFTPPGSPPECSDPGRVLGQKKHMIDGQQQYVVNQRKIVAPYVVYKYCCECEAIKPPRAHHCRVMERCIYDMDHYCPWMNNCGKWGRDAVV